MWACVWVVGDSLRCGRWRGWELEGAWRSFFYEGAGMGPARAVGWVCAVGCVVGVGGSDVVRV